MSAFGLGRLPSMDQRDKLYPMRAALPRVALAKIPARRTWTLSEILDQGETSRCVGYAWATKLRCAPIDRTPDPDTLYHGAQRNDEWPGEDYDGTSMRGGAKYLASVKELTEYRWAKNIADILDWLAFKGPVVVGTAWRDGMFETDADGLVNVSGAIAGEHAYCLIGKNDSRQHVTIANSWGYRWGKRTVTHPEGNGRGFMRYSDLARLVFERGGEACVAIKSGKR